MTTHPFDGPRGLKGYTQTFDTDGVTIEVQQSSAVWVGDFPARIGISGPFCWLRIYNQEWVDSAPTGGGGGMHASAHLTPEAAREIAAALTQWLTDVTEEGEST